MYSKIFTSATKKTLLFSTADIKGFNQLSKQLNIFLISGVSAQTN